MRIQHNILSMNAYRNYSNNTSALGKNLEKLSSGYKINRAGDDAAGLAISEKMRAQIKGLDAAQKNVKDGISFVKTAEGAMQEIQDMLSRMKYLATQSANGTYEDTVDRKALQDEVDSLLEEIDRIADSANFNDIFMLNGGAGGNNAATGPVAPKATIDDTANAAGINKFEIKFADDATEAQKTAIAGIAGDVKVKVTGADSNTTVDAGDKVAISGLTLPQGYTVSYKDEAGTDTAYTIGNDLEIGTGAGKIKAGEDIVLTLKDDAGKVAGTITVGMPTTAKADNSAAETTIKLEKGTAADTPATAAAGDTEAAKGPTFTPDATKLAAFEVKSVDVSGVKAEIKDGDKLKLKYDGDGTNGTFTATIGTKTFTGKVDKASGALGGQTIKLTGADAADGEITLTFEDTVTKFGTDKVAAGDSVAEADVGGLAPAAADNGNGGGAGTYSITLQIGDTAATYNQMVMNIQSMKTGSIGVAGLKINDIKSAAAAIDTIKNAINTVSSVRGQLGAYQNRLEHTANNLSVMSENITDAESTIRDTDVADEMMAYTKNNILIQSAQAMLAQANAVPQGVLQLLQ